MCTSYSEHAAVRAVARQHAERNMPPPDKHYMQPAQHKTEL
jgi:hypothetical protein